jgi:transcription-repair coupling factor (superfamily II helicase)
VDEWVPALALGVGGRLAPEWIPEEEVRLELYARLARLPDLSALEAFEDELADRFGEPPAEAQHLLTVARLRLLARAAQIDKVEAGPAAIAFTPRRGFTAKPDASGLVEKNGRLLLQEAIEDPLERLGRIEAVLAGLSEG